MFDDSVVEIVRLVCVTAVMCLGIYAFFIKRG